MNHYKNRRIKETEKVIKKILKGVSCQCSNDECENKITLTEEEVTRNIICSKCYVGYFVIRKMDNKTAKKRKRNKKFFKKEI